LNENATKRAICVRDHLHLERKGKWLSRCPDTEHQHLSAFGFFFLLLFPLEFDRMQFQDAEGMRNDFTTCSMPGDFHSPTVNRLAGMKT
jgi:hypothetical protein